PPASYPLSLHDALPICVADPQVGRPLGQVEQGLARRGRGGCCRRRLAHLALPFFLRRSRRRPRSPRPPRDAGPSPGGGTRWPARSEEHTSELQSRENLV